MRLSPAALIFRLGLGFSVAAAGCLAFWDASAFVRSAAHRFFWAAAMRFRAENCMLKLFPFLALVACLGFAAERSSDGVKAAEKSWASATLAGDESTLKQMLAGDLTYTHSNGETDTKAGFIDNLKTGARKYHKVDHEPMEVRLYGSTAMLTTVAQVETSQKGGKPNPVRLRFIHVWVWQQGRWQLVARQSLRTP